MIYSILCYSPLWNNISKDKRFSKVFVAGSIIYMALVGAIKLNLISMVCPIPIIPLELLTNKVIIGIIAADIAVSGWMYTQKDLPRLTIPGLSGDKPSENFDNTKNEKESDSELAKQKIREFVNDDQDKQIEQKKREILALQQKEQEDLMRQQQELMRQKQQHEYMKQQEFLKQQEIMKQQLQQQQQKPSEEDDEIPLYNKQN